MKNISLLLGVFITFNSLFSARAQGTAFTYQGQLNDGAQPANGIYDLQFTLHAAPAAGSVLAGPVTNSAVAVSKGLFTVMLDFGPSAFTGAERWLELAVRTNGAGAFATLAPRQLLTATPYAITAGNLTGTLPASQLTGTLPSGLLNGVYSDTVSFSNPANTFSGNGAGLTQLDASQLASGIVPDARLDSNVARTSQVWLLGGNAGTTPGAQFLGTTDNQPFEIKANNQRALRLEPNANGAPNIIGGSEINFAGGDVVGATISGGATNTIHSFTDYATIGGGRANTVESNAGQATIGGGRNNTILTHSSDATIGGGYSNTIQTNADFATIAGGGSNLIGTNATSATVAGGYDNTIQSGAVDGSIGGGWHNTIQTNAGRSTIGGGSFNAIEPHGDYVTIGGGLANTNGYGADHSTISGGRLNRTHYDADYATIGGGYANTVPTNADFAIIAGGRENSATNYAFAAGRRAKADHTGAFVWADSTDANFGSTTTNQFNVRASGGVRLETGGAGATLDGQPLVTTSNGSQITDLNASQLTSGTVPDARLSANVALLNNNQTFSGVKTFSTPPAFTAAGAPFTVSNTNKVAGLSADLLDGLNSSAFASASHNHDSTYVKLGGNALSATLALGTTDSQPLELLVSNQRGLRLEPNGGFAPNIIAGSWNNSVGAGVVGAAISGGSSNAVHANADYAAIAGGRNNLIAQSAENSSIGGGSANAIAALYSAIGGGNSNTIQDDADWAAIGGGQNNTIQSNATHGIVGGGYANMIQTSADYATIGGGRANTNGYDAVGSSIAGGQLNTIQSISYYSSIGGGHSNTIQTNSWYSSIAGGSANTIQTDTYYAVIGGGQANTIEPLASRAGIAGGKQNRIQTHSHNAAIGGGDGNTIEAYSESGTISGGRSNRVNAGGNYAIIPGGLDNAATNFAFAAGRRAKANHTGAFVWADSTAADFESKTDNQFSVRAKGGVRLETGGAGASLDGRLLLTLDGNASQLTSLDASQLASGTVPDARLSPNVALLDNVQTFTSVKTFSAAPAFTATGAPFTVSNTNKVINLSADLLDNLDSSAFAKVGGNALGTTLALGTADNQPLELKVNGMRALRLVATADSAVDADALPDGAPNAVAGSPANFVSAGVVGATVSGGGATNFDGTIGENGVSADYATVGGGMDNNVSFGAAFGAIAGGRFNRIRTGARYSAIGGGYNNSIESTNSTIGGGRQNTIQTNAVDATIAGGYANTIETDADSAAISGGYANAIQSSALYATIGGGRQNAIQPDAGYSAVGGGYQNTIETNADFSAISGGNGNTIEIDANETVIGGGQQNVIQSSAAYSTIGGGYHNVIETNATASIIGGGYQNTIRTNADFATIPGGRFNTATNYAFAAGHRAKANHTGAFVWGDSTVADIASTAANSVTMRASGGYRLFSNAGASTGVWLAPGGGDFTSMSDRNAKENFTPVDAQAVLDKVAALPLTTWNYKSQAPDIRHLGPMAQDFKAAFGLGESDTGITGVDADGVALAAIQGLNQKLENKLRQTETEITELKKTVSALQELVGKLALQQNGGAQ